MSSDSEGNRIITLLREIDELRDEVTSLNSIIEYQREDIAHHKSVADALSDIGARTDKKFKRLRDVQVGKTVTSMSDA